MLLDIELLSDDIMESKHDIASGFVIIFNPIFNVFEVEGILG